MREMTEGQLMWVAGIIEGEGHIGISGDRSPRIIVGMTDHDVIQRLYEWTGVGNLGAVQRVRPGRTKPMLHWSVTAADDFLDLAAALEPHLMERRTAKLCEVRAQLLEYRAEVAARKAERFTPGEGVCPEGHDKAVVGIYGANRCSECNRIRCKARPSRAIRTQQRRG